MNKQEALENFGALFEASPTEDTSQCFQEVFEQLYETAIGKNNATLEEQVEAADIVLTLAMDEEDEQ